MIIRETTEELLAKKNDPHSDFLAQYDECIQAAARKAIPRRLFPREVLDLEIDDLTQSIRIKLWQTLERKRPILNPKAYIYRIAYTGAIDLFRRRKYTVSLLLDEYGESMHDILLVALRREGEAKDPAYILEEKETIKEYIYQVTNLVLILPQQQQLAIMCWLKDHLEDDCLFAQALSEQGINLEMVDWPEEKEDLHRLKASVSIAKKKLCSFYSQPGR